MDHDAIRAQGWLLRIGGQALPADAGGTLATVDPATGDELCRVPDAGPADVEAAYRAARRAFEIWRGTTMAERAGVVRALADRLDAHAEELAVLDSIDSGNPLAAMRIDAASSAAALRLHAGLALAVRGDTLDGGSQRLHYTRHEPFGVVGRIVAYNHPLLYAVTRTAPVLLAGNAVLLKPAPQTPLSALRWAELVEDLLPEGLFNVLTGGRAAGEAIVAHPEVRRLAFTGSVAAGRAIQVAAARSAVKTVTLELGGKNPMIVFPDADLEAAAQGAFEGMNFTSTQGQSCGSTSRVLVHEDVYEPFVEALSAKLADLRVGPPLDPSTTMGPLISEQHLDSVRRWVDQGLAEGARRRFPRRADTEGGRGYYHPPTLLADVTGTMAVAREEIFGPVVAVSSFAREDDAIRIGNDSRYGLTASVWTKDLGRAHRVAHELEAGYVWVNGTSTHHLGMPFGGVKDSGVGREESIDEILSFATVKSVHVNLPAEAALR